MLDNLSTARPAIWRSDPHLTRRGDVQTRGVEQARLGCKAVVHLAAVASVQASVDAPVATHQSNFVGTLNVCQAMLR